MRFLAALIGTALLAASCTSGADSLAPSTALDTTEAPISEPSATSDDNVGTTEPDDGVDTTNGEADTETELTDDGTEPEPVTVLAVADLADCRGPDAEVAELVGSLEGIVVMPGDLAYDEGSAANFRDCFLPAYESELQRIYAVPGDNDYKTPDAAAYFDVMSDLPGEVGKGWYAVELGAWQLIALNSNCEEVGGCGEGSEQYEWLDAILQAEPYECRLVMWHLPRFTSSANYREIPRLGDMYGRLDGAGADILVVGNSHHYERLGPLAPSGEPADDGIMNFTVGMGGAAFTQFGEPRPGSQVRSNEHRGVLRLTLRPDGFDWEFVNVESNATPLVDAGSSSC